MAININELRKSAIEWECFEKFTGKVVGELLDRLEAAEKERDFAKTEIARLHDDIRELTDVRVLDAEDRDRIVAWRQGTSAKPAPSVPDGWLRAIDEALVTAHIGVANAEDTYEQAKAKLDNLIGFHVDVATDPAVNGGWKLVPIELTHEKEPTMQDALMKFDPATGEERPYPSHATQWRNWHGIAAWLFDPWTGRRRNAYDVGSDVHGLLIAPAGTLGRDMGGSCAEKNNVAGAQPAPSVPDGFSREDLEAVADGLDGYEKTVNVGNVTGEGDDHLESTTAYAARFIRTMLAATPETKP